MIRVGTKETMTVAELIAFLSTLPQHLPILATWEGVWAPIVETNFMEVTEHNEHVVLIDVNYY